MWLVWRDGMGMFPGGLRPPDPLTRGHPWTPFGGRAPALPPNPSPSRGVSHPPAPPGSQRFTRPLNFFTQKLCSQPSVPQFFSGHFLRETIELHSKTPSAMAALSDGAARRDSADP